MVIKINCVGKIRSNEIKILINSNLKKTKLISMILSDKQYTKQQKVRNKFARSETSGWSASDQTRSIF